MNDYSDQDDEDHPKYNWDDQEHQMNLIRFINEDNVIDTQMQVVTGTIDNMVDVGCIYASNPQIKSNILQFYFISFKSIVKSSKQPKNNFFYFFCIFTDIYCGAISISMHYLLYKGLCISSHLEV